MTLLIMSRDNFDWLAVGASIILLLSLGGFFLEIRKSK